ncbi:STE20/SPS1-related proline-alanine-rich protein kinase isoform X3 [Adelges cooleyi]|uniref:STE20/SPS1-related proline-alanine-rich protein kinase isoform X3 n=1 Tax=Adelges cooleyi TaxID=133065 RepID=UPI0021805521|nr:STE20/SPS1-related proline-alanine-rich protein kinase isoform X3 [Adelges cooleyi]
MAAQTTTTNAPLVAAGATAAASVANNVWPNTRDDYELREVIGVGATATVHCAYCKPRNEKCAIKKINLEKWNTSMDELTKEIQAMSWCQHENVVTYHTSFVVGDELWLVLRLLEGGSLLDILKHKMRTSDCRHGVLDEATIATVLREVLKGLEYFHSNSQIHRDIKAGNILLGEDGTVQIADFGVSAWLTTGYDTNRQKVRHTFVGTPCWMAPEVMEQNDPPTLDTGADQKDQYKAYGKTFRKLITDCLQKDPTKRPTATELLKHPIFKKAKDKKYLQSTLIAIGPSLETRVQKASKRQPGTSGRLHRTITGEWTWSSEEECGEQSSDDECQEKPLNKLVETTHSSDSEKESDDEHLNLVLRMRNVNRELNDIRFEFLLGKDTPEGIATELVGAGLVDGRDAEVIAMNLRVLIGNQTQHKPVTFALVSGCKNDETPDEKMLIGYAQLSYAD